MTKQIPCIHHITAITSDPQANLNFYARLLGLRLVKLTVNFDDPGTYHFYYGDETGTPGTIPTFFPWPGARRGRIGTEQVSTTSFLISLASLEYWRQRLVGHGVAAESSTRFVDPVPSFGEPDGLQLELIAAAIAEVQPGWAGGTVPSAHAIRGLHSATLSEESYEGTAHLLTDTMGWRQVAQDGDRFRFQSGTEGMGGIVDVVCEPNAPRGTMGAGTVHHIAWRADAEQLAWRAALVRQGLNVSPVMDRQYFHSIYFREPGGVLFEIATDPPGFTWDEAVTELGTHLKLPPWLESHRPRILQMLPALERPRGDAATDEGDSATHV